MEEFIEYYNNISANIDDDKYFEHMIVTGYKLGSTNQAYKDYTTSIYIEKIWLVD